MIDEHIDKLLNEFDWGRVAVVMHALNWTWQDGTKPPTIQHMREVAKDLLDRAALAAPGTELGWCQMASGGFNAYADTDGLVRLSFTVAEWEVGW